MKLIQWATVGTLLGGVLLVGCNKEEKADVPKGTTYYQGEMQRKGDFPAQKEKDKKKPGFSAPD
ncbi:MAG: hypothetical protein JST35_05245 [Armatimonadetes bacterium]|nr:hypothetical protein [Armatimonadota bacterium]